MQVKCYILITAVVLACLLASDLASIFLDSSGPKDAYVIEAVYPSEVFARQEVEWNFTVHNVNCAGDYDEEAWFFFVFYMGDAVWIDEYNDTTYMHWSCKKGQTTTRIFRIRDFNVIKPVRHNMKVELYWHNGNDSYLMDSVNFTFDVLIKMPLSHIYALSYFVLYLIAGFVLFFYYRYEEMRIA